jgi:integrase
MLCKCGNNLKSNKRFKVRIKLPNGKWKSKQVSSLELAKKVEAKFKTQSVEQEVFNIHKAPVIEEVWCQYLKWAKQNKRSWHDDEIRWTKHISPHLKGMKMDKMTPHDIQDVLDSMHEKLTPKGTPYAPATIRQVLVLVKRIFNWGIEQGLYHGLNPCASIAIPKFDNQVTNPLNTNSMESLMQVLSSWENERAVLAIKFALYTGKRKGEICKLTWDCVDLETGYITLKSTNTKSKETQTLPMNNKALAILHRCQELEICDYVFPSNEGSYYNTLNDTWKRIRKRAKINIRFHDLRHTYASYLASSGKVDIYTLKELLGHSTIEMTQRYAHLINGALKKAACVADEVF